MLSAIVQARMGSTRLPGKILMEVNGKSLLEYLIERLQSVKEIKQVIVATTEKPQDEEVGKLCKKLGVKCYRGEEDDVLGRIYQAALNSEANPILRITADCPLIDPKILSEQIEFFYKKKVDYCFLGLTFAEGICADLFSFESLQKAFNSAIQKDEREHVTPYFHKHKELFKIANYENETDDSRFRIVVDQEEDFEVVSMIIKNLYKKGNELFDIHQIKEYLIRHPDIYKLNAAIKRNDSYDAFKL